MTEASKPPPRVSVLIVSHDRADDLKLVLEAVFATRWPNLEVVVVDNASSDSSPRVAQSFSGVTFVPSNKNLGFAEGNNLALKAATGQYVALVNHDAVIAPDWIERLVTFLEARHDAAAAGGREYFWNDDNPVGSTKNHFWGARDVRRDLSTPADTDKDDAVREVATLPGMAVMIKKKAILEAGAPFLEPTFFMYYEETDFFARVVRKGWKLWYVGAAACWHRTAGRRALSRNVVYHLERNRILFAWRHATTQRVEKLEKRLRQRATAALWEGPFKRVIGSSQKADACSARRAAWRWIEENRGLLDEHRKRWFPHGHPFDDLARSIQSRADYHGKPRPEVAALVPADARNVLDVGCAGGGLGRTIKQLRPEAKVRGIEPSPEAVAIAKDVLDDVRQGTAEAVLPPGWPRPDVIVFSDVLEHTTDPWAVLLRWRAQLAQGGTLIVSLPNVTHKSVLAPLLRGRFDYEPEGVLDKTHVRFFTRATAIELVESGGFEVVDLKRVETPSTNRVLGWMLRGIARRQMKREISREQWGKPGLKLADVYTLQFLITAK